VERVKAFHGYDAPGIIIGGFMVDLAYRHLPEGGLLDALSETPKCWPDAIQHQMVKIADRFLQRRPISLLSKIGFYMDNSDAK
jgi:hypothetical protein